MLVDGARYEGGKTRPVSLLVTSPKKSHKVCTVYYFTINLGKPPVLCTTVLSGRVWLSAVVKGTFALCYTARRGV